jgi:hypothetical protein
MSENGVKSFLGCGRDVVAGFGCFDTSELFLPFFLVNCREIQYVVLSIEYMHINW